MKRNAKLYLPWPVISAFVAPVAVPATDAQLYRGGMPLASVERLKGGCLLYRLTAAVGQVMAEPIKPV
jgi:hypothetical protein